MLYLRPYGTGELDTGPVVTFDLRAYGAVVHVVLGARLKFHFGLSVLMITE